MIPIERIQLRKVWSRYSRATSWNIKQEAQVYYPRPSLHPPPDVSLLGSLSEPLVLAFVVPVLLLAVAGVVPRFGILLSIGGPYESPL